MTPVSAVPVSARLQPASQDPGLLDPLLRLAGDLRGTHALVVAEHGLDLLCGLIRHGCLAATVLRIGDKPDAASYDLVAIPDIAAFRATDDVIRLALRSLAPQGRLIAGVRGSAAAAALARRLRLNGFANLRSIHTGGLTMVRAEPRIVS